MDVEESGRDWHLHYVWPGFVGGGAMPERPGDISDHDGVFHLKRGSGTGCRQGPESNLIIKKVQ
jgi:hypothetical protein